MTLKYTLDTLPDDLPEAHRALYREDNGKFVLDIEGAAPKARVDEFRQNNIELAKQRDALAAALKEKGATAEEMAQAIQRHQTELDEARAKERAATKKLRDVVFRQEVTSKALASGALPSAVDDIVFRASRSFDIDDDGALVGRDDQAADPQAWLGALKDTAPHLFNISSGGGAHGNTRPAIMQSRIKTRADLGDAAAKAHFIHEHGMDKYLALPPAPGVKAPGTVTVTKDSELRKQAIDAAYIEKHGLQR
jgi:hypothetical protein